MIRHPLGSVLIIMAVCALPVIAQEDTLAIATREGALKVFLDCQTRCDEDYIRREVGFVNYMLERQEATLYILITAQRTGAGGRKITINMIGQGPFTGRADTVNTVTLADDTDDLERTKMVAAINLGLVPYDHGGGADRPSADGRRHQARAGSLCPQHPSSEVPQCQL